MDVAFFASVAVGVVPLPARPGRIAVVVKATLSIAQDGEATLASPRPLDLDRASKSAPDELAAASDFAPSKARADILLVGHARTSLPSQTISCGFAVGPIERRFVARSSIPMVQIPLRAAYLRASATPGSAHVRVGPGALDRGGNVAPPEQQIDGLREDARIVLDGLIAKGARRDVILPSLRPQVFVVDRATRVAHDAIDLVLDTLTIDTDAAECALVWRGVATAFGLARPCLAVGLDRVGAAWNPADVGARLQLASWGVAAEPPRQSAPSEPEVEAPRRPTPPPQSASWNEEVTVIRADPTEDRGADAMPFRAATIALPQLAEDDLLQTRAFDESPLPFRPAALPFAHDAPPALPPDPPRRPRPPVRKGTVTTAFSLDQLRAPALPFDAPPVVPAPAPIGPPIVTAPPVAPAPPIVAAPPIIPAPHFTPEPLLAPPPLPATPVPPPVHIAPTSEQERAILSIEAYAAVRADLAKGGKKREILARHGLTIAAWKREDRLQMELLEAEALAGRTDRAAALSAALAAAWPTKLV